VGSEMCIRDSHREHCVFIEDGYRAIRNHQHKAILYDNGETEYFDMEHDPEECSPTTLQDQNPMLFGEMSNRFNTPLTQDTATQGVRA